MTSNLNNERIAADNLELVARLEQAAKPMLPHSTYLASLCGSAAVEIVKVSNALACSERERIRLETRVKELETIIDSLIDSESVDVDVFKRGNT